MRIDAELQMSYSPKGGLILTVPDGKMLHIILANGDYLNLTDDGKVIMESPWNGGSYSFSIPSVQHTNANPAVIQLRKEGS